MKILTIDLKKEYSYLESCEVTAYLHEGNSELPNFDRNALVVVTGGGYAFVSDRECEPIATEFYNRGYNCFTIKYSIFPKAMYPVALLQVSCLIDHIKKCAAQYSIDKNKVFAIGFSAGGHLVGSVVSAKINCASLDSQLGERIAKLDSALNGIIMSYPVINFFGHHGSFDCLLGDDAQKKLADSHYSYLNLDSSVTNKNPPTFIWCTANDACVNSANSLTYALALQKAGVSFELHIYQSGSHGLSLADNRVYASPTTITENIKNWVPDASLFLSRTR